MPAGAAGHYNFLTTLGTVSGNSFTPIGTMTWGYGVSAGNSPSSAPSYYGVTAGTAAQQNQSMSVFLKQFPNWTVPGH
jgi:hypothetical protein